MSVKGKEEEKEEEASGEKQGASHWSSGKLFSSTLAKEHQLFLDIKNCENGWILKKLHAPTLSNFRNFQKIQVK